MSARGTKRRRFKKLSSGLYSSPSVIAAGHYKSEHSASHSFGPPEAYASDRATRPSRLAVVNLQKELDAAQEHLWRFVQLFDEVKSDKSQADSALPLPKVDPLRVRPVSPVGITAVDDVTRSELKRIRQQVAREVEEARQAHTENDDFADW